MQNDKNSVDIKLGKITVDFRDEELDIATITDESIALDGDIAYQTRYEGGVLSVLIQSNLLEFDKEYTLTLDGLKLAGGKTVTKKEYKFRTMKNEPVVSDEEYIEYEDFEDWTNDTSSQHYTDNIITSGGFRTWTTQGVVAGKDGGKALTPMMGTSQASRTLQYYFVPKLENDTFRIEFDYYPGDIENYNNIKFSIFRSKDGYGVEVVPKEGMTAFSNEWGHITLEAKPANSTWSVIVTNAQGDTVYENPNGAWSDANIAMLDWTVSVIDASKLADEANRPKIDNFTVNAIYNSAPVLTDKSLKIYENDNEQSLSSVSPASNRIVVDFGQRMMPSDMNSDNIYLTSKGDTSKKIATVDKYSGGKYEMSPVEYLTAGKEYTVHIEKCTNVSGFEMSKAYSFDFETDGGDVSVELEKITQGGTDVLNLSDLSAGDATVNILYKNSTGKSYLLHYIIAFYKDNEMVYSAYNTALLKDDASNQTVGTVVTIPDVASEYDEVNIIAWDGFNSMLPVSKPLVIR